MEAAAVGDYVHQKYYDWRGTPDVDEYLTRRPRGAFTVETYCEEALMDRRGSMQLNT